MNHPALARIAVLLALSAGCQTHAASCPDDPTAAAAYAAWSARHVSDYTFVWQRTCFCLPDAVQPIVVTVRHGEIVSATDRSGTPVSADIRNNLLTIDALYRRAADARCTADEVRVTAAQDGIPSNFFIDPRRGVADDEFNVAISEFSAAP